VKTLGGIWSEVADSIPPFDYEAIEIYKLPDSAADEQTDYVVTVRCRTLFDFVRCCSQAKTVFVLPDRQGLYASFGCNRAAAGFTFPEPDRDDLVSWQTIDLLLKEFERGNELVAGGNDE
jgi:hypothetical protein